jgi:large subunit ribosomal protein L9
MKVLFLQDVLPTARAGDIKDVKNGFGRNFLLPRGLAVLATQEELRRAEALREDARKRREAEARDWQDIVSSVRDAEIKIEARTGPTGRLYGSVTSAMIAEEISRLAERDIDRRGVRIPQPIRTVGEHEVHVRFYDGVEATMKVEVLPDEESIARNRAAREEDARAAATVAEERVTDLSFEEVLEAAEARIDQETKSEEAEDEETGQSEESEDSGAEKES